MGITAYNRASRVISRRIAEEKSLRPTAFLITDRINSMSKFPLREVIRFIKPAFIT